MMPFRLVVKFIVCLFIASALIGCDKAPIEIEAPITQDTIDHRQALEQAALTLKTVIRKDFDQWKQIILDTELLETDLAKVQSGRTLEVLSIEVAELSDQVLLELIDSLKQSRADLSDSMSLLQQWYDVKHAAMVGKSSYSQLLKKYQIAVDHFDIEIWNKISESEQDEAFLLAINEYQFLIPVYAQKIKAIESTVIERQTAELAQQTWQSILPVRGIAIKMAKGANTSWESANKKFTAQLHGQAVGQFIEAKEQWQKAYEQGLIALAYPAMVEVSGGKFTMGDEAGIGDKDERPLKSLNVSSFKMSQTEVTFSQYDVYAKANNLPLPNDEGWGRGDRPVINVSWQEAQAFIKWLSSKTGKALRLPKEAEWEYAAKANRPDPFNKNKDIGNLANCEGCYRWGNTESTPVGQFPANSFGLHDMQGNVWEWTEDCYEASTGGCQKKSVRGGSWYDLPSQLRASNRSTAQMDKQSNRIGFRIVEDLNTTSVAQE